jgi:hypothetical protein
LLPKWAKRRKKKMVMGKLIEYLVKLIYHRSEYYDEEGNFIWGQEGNEWDWYYKEDKEAFERGGGTIHHPNVLNPP